MSASASGALARMGAVAARPREEAAPRKTARTLRMTLDLDEPRYRTLKRWQAATGTPTAAPVLRALLDRLEQDEALSAWVAARAAELDAEARREKARGVGVP
jgi:hypothetical protein